MHGQAAQYIISRAQGSAIVDFGTNKVSHLQRSYFSECMVCVNRTYEILCILRVACANVVRICVYAATVVACALCVQ